jgi:hypothetical protein
MNLQFDSRKIAFLLMFSVLSLLLYQFNFSKIIGANQQYFTGFQFIGPIAGGILSPGLGMLSVLAVEGGNFILGGKPLDLVTFVRFFPMAFAAIYFGTQRKSSALIAAACMVLFWLNPIGQQAWYYALYWLIPIAAAFYKQNLFVRSLGTTFTAHAIGSVVFLYAFPMPAAAWLALIPVVAAERLAFAAGISVSYVVVTTMLSAFSSKVDLSFLRIEERYSLVKA